VKSILEGCKIIKIKFTKMNTLKAKLIAGSGVVMTALTLAISSAHAQFSTTTAVTAVNTVVSDTGTIIGQVVVTILALMTALIGLGWGVRKFKRYVSGRKF